MDLLFTPDEEEFRDDVKTFLAENLPKELVHKVMCGMDVSKEEQKNWHAVLNSRGWLAASWPKEFGGTGWTPIERHIFEEECGLAGAPRLSPFGLMMLGPVLLKFGTDVQKRFYLPKILSGEHWWCQGYSEPEAGSDLANLRTSAVREDDSYLINGQKTWTTQALHANMIFCLVRTSTIGKPQEGISFVLVDMNAPGVEVRPIRLIEGGCEVNEVFFTDVRVPISNRIGDENMGWTIAKYLLTHERTNIVSIGLATRDLTKLKKLAVEQVRNGRPLIEDPLFMAELVETEIDLEALRITNLRVLAGAKSSSATAHEASLLKLKGTRLRQQIQSLSRQALGAHAAPYPAHDLPDNARVVSHEVVSSAESYFNHRKLSIFGGSNEIQRNIVAKSLFGG